MNCLDVPKLGVPVGRRAEMLGPNGRLLRFDRPRLGERLLARYVQPMHLAGMLLDPRDQLLLRTSSGPATVASHEQLIAHEQTLPLVPTGWHTDRDLGLPVEELGEELADLRAARERSDRVG